MLTKYLNIYLFLYLINIIFCTPTQETPGGEISNYFEGFKKGFHKTILKPFRKIRFLNHSETL